MGSINSLFWGLRKVEELSVHSHAVITKLAQRIFLLHFRVVYVHYSLVLHKQIAHSQRRSFSHIARVFLKCKAKDCNLLTCHCVEKRVNYTVSKGSLMVVVHIDHLLPVMGYFLQS